MVGKGLAPFQPQRAAHACYFSHTLNMDAERERGGKKKAWLLMLQVILLLIKTFLVVYLYSRSFVSVCALCCKYGDQSLTC